MFDKPSRQQIVLRGLEHPWQYNLYLQTGAFSLARQLGVERRRSMSPDGLAEPSPLERLERVVLHNDGARVAQKPVADFAVLTLARGRHKAMGLREFGLELFIALREPPLKSAGLHLQRLPLFAVTNHVNRFIVVRVRRLTTSLHRTLDPAHSTVIRIGFGCDLHFANLPVLSRICELSEAGVNRHALILAGVGVLQRACAFRDELKVKALLTLVDVAHDAVILHLVELRGIRRILQSPGEPVVVLVDAHTVRVAGKLEDRLFGLPNNVLRVRPAFNRMQASLGADEPRRAALVDVAFHRDPSSSSNLLCDAGLDQMCASRRLSVQSYVGMDFIFAQAKTNARIAESLCPFLALWNGSCGFSLGRRTHF